MRKPRYRSRGQLTGSLTGFLELYALDGTPITDASGVTVAVEGTSYKAVSTAGGTWHIDGLPAGTYTLDYSKAGFAGARIFGYQFTGGGEAFIDEVRLGQQGAARTTSLRAEIANRIDTVRFSEPRLVITATFSEPVSQVTAFFASSPSIAPDSGRYTAMTSINWSPRTSAVEMVLTDINQLKNQGGYRSGDTVYMALYSLGYGGTQYYDPRVRKVIHSAAIPAIRSNVFSFTMP